MSQTKRPLSPHMQVYRPTLSMVMSITHRITGIALCGGAVLLAYWLIALAAGESSFATAAGIVGSIPGQLILFVFTAALYYHLCNGVRHLFWDTGRGLEIATAQASGYAALFTATALTLITWALALMSGGGA